MDSYDDWFSARFEEVCRSFQGRRFAMDPGVPDHDEATSLRKSRRRYEDSLRLLLPELRAPGERRFLDVGGGQIAWLVAPLFPGRTFAADLGDVFAEEGRRLGVESRPWDLRSDEAPFDAESFDVVAFTEVIEHLPPPPFPYVRRVVRLLKPGGVLLFSCPNLAAFAKRLKFLLFGRSPVKLGTRYHERAGIPDHIREYTVPEIRSFLRSCGLRVERITGGDYGFGAWRRATTLLARIRPSLGRSVLVRAYRG
ncbi:MAG: class I SAM-dependent methyltransferase [Planctomycetota bacterium]